MIKRLSFLVFSAAVLWGLVGIGLAQDNTPPTALINAALADLSQRAGRTIALGDLTSWRWTQSNYPDTSLGCPQSGVTYTQVTTNGYSLLLTYSGATFDYRATPDGSTLFLCSGPATVPAAPAAAATYTPVPAAPTATAEGRSVCPDALNTRLQVGAQGRGRADGLPVNIRSLPTASSAKVGQIAPGDTFDVIGGPECAESLVWWEIAYGDVQGWAAEGANGLYWIEPTGQSVAQPTATPASVASTPAFQQAEGAQVYDLPDSPQTIAVANADQLDRFIELRINESLTGAAWSPDGQWIAVSTQSGLRLYNLQAIRQTPRLFQVPNGPTNALAFDADGSLLVTGHEDGTVRLWDIATGGLRGLLRGHTQPVRTVAISPDGTRVASGAGDASSGELMLWDAAAQTEIATLSGHTQGIASVAFSPDGALLASGSLDGSVRLWDVATASPGTVLPGTDGAIYAVIFSPDGSWLAYAGENGAPRLWEVGPGTQMALQGDTAPATVLCFSPDGSLLASGGAADGLVHLWNPATTALVQTLPAFDDPAGMAISGLAFNPEGSLLAIAETASTGSVVRIVGVAP